MSIEKEMLAVLADFAKQPGMEFVMIDDMMAAMPKGTKRHNVQTAMTKIARIGRVGKGQPAGPGHGSKRKYKIIPIPTAEAYAPKEPEEPVISFEELGKAVYTRLVTLSRKLSDAEDKLQDVKIKLSDERKYNIATQRKLNNTIRTLNTTVANLQAQIRSPGGKVKLSEILHTSKKQS